MDKGCSISNLVKVQQKAGGDGSGGSGSQENTKNGGTGASGDERLCPAAGGAGPRVVAGGSGSRDDRVGGGVGDGGGGGSDGGGGSGDVMWTPIRIYPYLHGRCLVLASSRTRPTLPMLPGGQSRALR